MNATLTQPTESTVDYEAFETGSGKAIMHSEAQLAFESICDKTHWKNPINVEMIASIGWVEIVSLSIRYFTGSAAHISRVPGVEIDPYTLVGRFRIVADGYYATIGA